MKKEQNEKDFKICIFPLVMTVITFIVGFHFYWDSKGVQSCLRLIIILIGYLPTIIFFIILLICYFKYKTKNSKKIITIITITLTVGLFFYYITAIFICAFIEVKNPITSISNYKDKVNDKRLLKVFPKEIPNNVDDLYFIYSPGILQGETEISLYYIDKNMTINKFDKEYKIKAEWIGHKEEYTEKKGLFTGAFSNTPAEYKNEDDYIIYLVESRCDNSGYCNHGDFLFVAFNDKTNEIIYKSEQW